LAYLPLRYELGLLQYCVLWKASSGRC